MRLKRIICKFFGGHIFRLESCDRDTLECEDVSQAKDHLICIRCGIKREIPCVLGD